MVKLTEVEDEHFSQDQPGPAPPPSSSTRRAGSGGQRSAAGRGGGRGAERARGFASAASSTVDVAAENEEDDEDYFTDTDSSLSSSASFAIASAAADDEDALDDESLAERLLALRDMIPARQRAALAQTLSTASSWVMSGLRLGGKTVWVVSTSALLVGLPWALAFADEAQMIEMEKEMRLQQGVNEVLAPGVTSAVSQHLEASGGQAGAQQGRL